MVIKSKCAHHVFDVHRMTVSTKCLNVMFFKTILILGTARNILSARMCCICSFFQMHKRMPSIVMVTMAMTVGDVTDLGVFSCSFFIHGSGGSVKICCSGAIHGWTASVL